MIEQSPAVRALGGELGRAIRLDLARRARRRRAAAVLAAAVLVIGGAFQLAEEAPGGEIGTRSSGRTGEALVVPVGSSSSLLPDASWLPRPAAFVN